MANQKIPDFKKGIEQWRESNHEILLRVNMPTILAHVEAVQKLLDKVDNAETEFVNRTLMALLMDLTEYNKDVPEWTSH